MDKPKIVNHIITAAGQGYMQTHYAKCSDVREKPHYDCNWDSESNRPSYCGTCRFEATDTESPTLTDYCLACRITPSEEN